MSAGRSDVIVVGSGAAGLRAALTLAGGCRVLLLTRATLIGGGATPRAQGGIAAALGPDDSPELHSRDTLAAGAGYCDPAAVDVLVGEGPRQVLELVELGARFDRGERGGLDLAREGAHSRRRIVHAGGDATGAEIVRALAGALARHRQAGRVDVREHAFALDLVTRAGRCRGVVVREASGAVISYEGDAVIVATGGAAHLYARTTSPPEATGDGIAMAWRAGAAVADLEFVQFHPTALDDGSDPLALLSEAIRGEGAVLVDQRGRRFMRAVHPLAELAPRDVVSRAIWRRLRDGDRIYLDAREAPGGAFAERFPAVFALCAARGLDPRRDLLPVTPAAHYLMGGVAVDLYGRTSLPGLYACGEVACTRVHGANRLASNSLLESVVFADRAAHDILAGGPPAAWPAFGAAGRRDTPGGGALQPHPTGAATGRSDPSLPAAAAADPAGTIAEVRRLMWEDVGLERTRTGLERALGRLDGLGREPAAGTVDAVNVVTVARLVAEAALARPHSLGSHYRADDPGTGGRAAG